MFYIIEINPDIYIHFLEVTVQVLPINKYFYFSFDKDNLKKIVNKYNLLSFLNEDVLNGLEKAIGDILSDLYS